MATWILIDKSSGYVWGDSRDLEGKIFTGDALEFAEALDKSTKAWEPGEYRWAADPTGAVRYFVYRVDIAGSEAVSVVHDGQDQDTIAAVESSCRYEGAITFVPDDAQ